MKRDNPVWLWLMAGAILSTFSAHFDLLERCCDLGDKAKALIELASLVLTGVSGVMYKSPLRLSDKGRRHYAAKSDTVRLDR
jgi:hypothetical protein